MIYIRTCAYNAEKTLKKAVDSILNQTIGEFKYYLLDNGSTDGTGELVRKYAEQDDRIVPFYNKVNRNYVENPDFWLISHQLRDEDYLVVLDADDWYENNFLEEMIAFVKENQLDMAACGTEFFDAETGKPKGARVLSESLILSDAQSYEEHFGKIHWNLRQTWGKVFSGKVARARYEMEMPDWFPRSYGGDTMNVLVSLEDAERIGVYAKVLHHYAVSKTSVSYKWMEGRDKADYILHKKTKDFIQKKAGKISEVNEQFLYAVYFNALLDTLKVLVNSSLTRTQLLTIIDSLFDNEEIKNALQAEMTMFGTEGCKKAVNEYRLLLLDWMFDEITNLKAEDELLCKKIFSVYNEDIDSLIAYESIKLLATNERKLMKSLLMKDYQTLLEDIYTVLCEADIKEPKTGCLIILAQNTSAYVSAEEAYIMYSKCWMRYLLENGENEALQKELVEWLMLLPDDAELLEMKEILEG